MQHRVAEDAAYEGIAHAADTAAACPAPPALNALLSSAAVLTFRLFFASALFWLLVTSVLAFICAIKLHTPAFLAGSAWLTFGRLRPAHVNTAIYGWAALAGLGTLLWLQMRLCHVPLPLPNALSAGCILWNLALAAGTVSILAGGSTGMEWLEIPPLFGAMFVAVCVLILVVSLVMLARRAATGLYISQWYLLGAALWFPLLYVLAATLLHGHLVTGVVQATVNWWLAHNVLTLWLTPLALASAYYLVPKLLDRPLYSEALSRYGFWTLIAFYNLAAAHHLIGGPLPVWLVSAGVAASVLLIVPVVAVTVNLGGTLRGRWREVRTNPVLAFVVVGATGYLLVSLQGAVQALRTVNAVTHFTHYTVAHAHLGTYGFFSLVMFGAAYYVLPRVTGGTLPAARLLWLHFWSAVGGIAVYWLGLSIGGIVQGLALADASVPFSRLMEATVPWLGVRTAAGYALLVGHGLFAWNVWAILRGRRAELANIAGAEPASTLVKTGGRALAGGEVA